MPGLLETLCATAALALGCSGNPTALGAATGTTTAVTVTTPTSTSRSTGPMQPIGCRTGMPAGLCLP